jgi:hypothetical protein
VETYEVTFDETIPCSIPVFECASEQEFGESIFVEEEQEDSDWGDPKSTPLAAPIELAMTTSVHNPDPSTSTTWGAFEELPHHASATLEEALAAVEGEATSIREAPWHI